MERKVWLITAGRPPLDDARDGLFLGRQAAAHDALVHGQLGRARGIEGHQRVQAEHQVYAVVHGHAGVHGLLQGAVHVVMVVDFHRRKQARQGRTGLHGFGDGHVVPAGAAEGRGVAAVQVGRHQRQAGAELAEVVGAPGFGEQLLELRVDFVVGKDAGGQGRPQGSSAWTNDLRPNVARQAADASRPGSVMPRRRNSPYAGTISQAGSNTSEALSSFSIKAAHKFARRHAVGQAGGDEAAGRDADIVMQPVNDRPCRDSSSAQRAPIS
jgi:hypothetical protein